MPFIACEGLQKLKTPHLARFSCTKLPSRFRTDPFTNRKSLAVPSAVLSNRYHSSQIELASCGRRACELIERWKAVGGNCLRGAVLGALLLCGIFGSSYCLASTKGDLQTTDVNRQQYDNVVKLHAARSHLPSQGEARMLMDLNQDLFTEDAWEGMKTILKVAELVESRMDAEKEAGCVTCKDNRLLVEKAWQIIANEYYDPHEKFSQAAWANELLQVFQDSDGLLRSKQESYKAVQNMMASLNDRYTEFLTPTQFRRALRRPRPTEREYLERQYTGIGLQIGRHSSRGGWLVEGPLAESPAEGSGILAGQRLIEIGGYPADLLSPLELSALMRGPAGSEVSLTLADPGGHPRLHLLQLERASLPQPPTKVARLEGDVQYVRVHYFSSDASRAFEQAIHEAEDRKSSGIIIDLRNNPGGVFEEAVSMASMMLNDGCVVAKTVRNSNVIDNTFRVGALSKEVFPARMAPLTTMPVAILLNHGSASASEVFAGALQDNKRATVVGEQSFGKGVVQHYFPFSDGSGLKVTVLKYITPSGHDISKTGGILPDVACGDFPHPGTPSSESDSCIANALVALQKRK